MILFYIACIYAVIYISFIMKVLTTPSKQSETKSFAGKISVLIPFRNESPEIKNCIQSILDQQLENDYEIILVNDHSEDDFQNQIPNHESVSLIHLEDGIIGKKKAIEKGVDNATGEIIVTIDADCVATKNWLTEISKSFEKENVILSLGSVYVNEEVSVLSLIQSSESLILGALTKYGVDSNKPILASGANITFRKEAFLKLNPYHDNQNIPSGDDMFLLEKVLQTYGANSIVFHSATTLTRAVESWSEFFNQRVRWARKMKNIKDLKTSQTTFFIALFNVFLFFLLIYSKFQMKELYGLLAVKFIFDFALLFKQPLKNKKHIFFAPLFFIWNLFYPLMMLSALIFVKPEWKNRALEKE